MIIPYPHHMSFVELRIATAVSRLVRRDIAQGNLLRAATRQRLAWQLMGGCSHACN